VQLCAASIVCVHYCIAGFDGLSRQGRQLVPGMLQIFLQVAVLQRCWLHILLHNGLSIMHSTLSWQITSAGVLTGMFACAACQHQMLDTWCCAVLRCRTQQAGAAFWSYSSASTRGEQRCESWTVLCHAPVAGLGENVVSSRPQSLVHIIYVCILAGCHSIYMACCAGSTVVHVQAT
jgi:hypothetical protein